MKLLRNLILFVALAITAAQAQLYVDPAALPSYELGRATGPGNSYDFGTGALLVKGVATQPVSAASLPLPTGAATAANQATSNATLATIATNSLKLPTTTAETHVSVQTAAVGTNYTAFAAQACLLLDIVNTSGTDIEITRGGTGVAIRVPNNSARMFGAITNANQLSVRRVDTSNTQVAVTAVAITP